MLSAACIHVSFQLRQTTLTDRQTYFPWEHHYSKTYIEEEKERIDKKAEEEKEGGKEAAKKGARRKQMKRTMRGGGFCSVPSSGYQNDEKHKEEAGEILFFWSVREAMKTYTL